MRNLKKGSRGNDVRELQRKLNNKKYNAGKADGIFGDKTHWAVVNFQCKNGLKLDGIAGKSTQKKLGMGREKGNNQTRELQRTLNQIGINVGKADGLMGKKTRNGIREFQRTFGLKADGIAGKNTWNVLNKAKKVTHFKVREFKCKHCGKIKLDIDLLVKLEELRKKTGPLVVNSGYRCPAHNRNVGGAKNSQHVKGTAADIRATKMSANNVYNHANRIFNRGGVGKYRNFTHVDTRGFRARW